MVSIAVFISLVLAVPLLQFFFAFESVFIHTVEKAIKDVQHRSDELITQLKAKNADQAFPRYATAANSFSFEVFLKMSILVDFIKHLRAHFSYTALPRKTTARHLFRKKK